MRHRYDSIATTSGNKYGKINTNIELQVQRMVNQTRIRARKMIVAAAASTAAAEAAASSTARKQDVGRKRIMVKHVCVCLYIYIYIYISVCVRMTVQNAGLNGPQIQKDEPAGGSNNSIAGHASANSDEDAKSSGKKTQTAVPQ